MLLSCPLLYANSKEVDNKLRATEVFIDEISDLCVLKNYINIHDIVNGENTVSMGNIREYFPCKNLHRCTNRFVFS